MRKHFLVAATVLGMLSSVVQSRAQVAELRLLAAVGVRQIVLELGTQFETASGHKLLSTFDASGLVVRRIRAGEQFDLVIINQPAIEALLKSGNIIAGSTTDVASSVTAAAVRKGMQKPDISTIESFKHVLLAVKSIARPSAAVGGASGDHITKVLERLGIAEQVNAKSGVSERPDDRSAMPGNLVANGQAELALHQLQELMAVPGLEILGPFPGELQGTFMFTAALVSGTKQQAAAKALIDFLRSPEAKDLIKAKGMAPAGG